MEEGRPSITAIASAMVRAAHLLWDDDPKIFQDHLRSVSAGLRVRLPCKRPRDKETQRHSFSQVVPIFIHTWSAAKELRLCTQISTINTSRRRPQNTPANMRQD